MPGSTQEGKQGCTWVPWGVATPSPEEREHPKLWTLLDLVLGLSLLGCLFESFEIFFIVKYPLELIKLYEGGHGNPNL
jgi:hypothetical protein